MSAAFPAALTQKNTTIMSVYQTTAQSLADVTWTTLVHQAKEVDTCNGYNPSTGRYTPNVAGWYHINGEMYVASGTCFLQVYKNGNPVKYGGSGISSGSVQINALVYLNGASDYITLVGYQNSGAAANTTIGVPQHNYFQAFWVTSGTP
jgi:hypothetical protein